MVVSWKTASSAPLHYAPLLGGKLATQRSSAGYERLTAASTHTGKMVSITERAIICQAGPSTSTEGETGSELSLEKVKTYY